VKKAKNFLMTPLGFHSHESQTGFVTPTQSDDC